MRTKAGNLFGMPIYVDDKIPTDCIAITTGKDTHIIRLTEEEPMTPTRRQVWAEIKDRCTASVVVQTKPFTIAIATATHDDRIFGGFGAACCSRKDEWNPTTGANIAKGRAISNLLDTIMASLKGEA